MAHQVASWGPVAVDATGNVLDGKAGTIGQVASSSTEYRVFPKTGNANTNNYPTLEAYLDAEQVDGRTLIYLGQSFIVTRS